MRRGVFLFCAGVLGFCLWLLLHRPMLAKPTSPVTQDISAKNAVAGTHSAINSETNQEPAPPAVPQSTMPVAVVSTPATIVSNAIDPALLSAWQAPIEFYGKVEDINSNPIAGVQIRFRWSETPAQDGMRSAEVVSDADGSFSLTGKQGRSLTVYYGKSGYHSLQRGERTFLYALGPDIITPDALHPVIFYLQKTGTAEPLMRLASPIVGPKQYRLDAGGTPTLISFYLGKRVTQGAAQFSVTYFADNPNESGNSFKWRCLVSVPGGGLQPTTEELPVIAPEQGYRETVEIDSDPHAWSDHFEQAYYFNLPDGKYGCMKFNLACAGTPSFGVEVLINPSGSRNLEYDKYLPGNIMVDQSAP